jgi:hypothetical protein
MLLLDFCNIQEWSVKKISWLYDKYKIIHTAEGRKQGKELFCFTKHEEKGRYYFLEDIPLFLGEITRKFCFPPSHPKSKNLWEMLKKSQHEYRAFLDQCIKGRLNIEYINNLSEGVSIRFTNNPKNKFLPFYSFEMQEINNIESYVELDILNISLNRAGPWIEDMKIRNIDLKKGERSLVGRIRKCPNCNKYFIYNKNPTRKYCDNKCKNSYYNKQEDTKAKQKKKIYEERAKGRYQ